MFKSTHRRRSPAPAALGAAALLGLQLAGCAPEDDPFDQDFTKESKLDTTAPKFAVRADVPVRIQGRRLAFLADEASLAANRRVEFHIVRQLQPDEDLPAYRSQILLPWSGEPIAIELRERPDQQPEEATEGTESPAPPIEERETLDPEEFLQDDEEDSP